jgi:hypothetical protein
MTIEDRLAALERDNIENKRQLATLAGSFQFITGQLKNMQDYMHAKFEAIDGRLDHIDGRLAGIDGRLDGIDGRLDRIAFRLNGIESKVDALPHAIATIIAELK